MVFAGFAVLAAYLQRTFMDAVMERDGVRSLVQLRAAGQRPELTPFAAMRGDAAYYVRQLRRRQPEPAIERKRLAALAGIAVAVGTLAWLLWAPA
jgi:hypothetical protein